MKVEYIKALNTPHRYIPVGTVAEVDADEGKALIEGGIAKAVSPKRPSRKQKEAP